MSVARIVVSIMIGLIAGFGCAAIASAEGAIDNSALAQPRFSRAQGDLRPSLSPAERRDRCARRQDQWAAKGKGSSSSASPTRPRCRTFRT